MTPEEVIPLCSNCGTELIKIKGKFGPFWGCKNFKECGFKGFSAKGEQPKIKPEIIRESTTRDQVLLEEIQGLREEMIRKFEATRQMLVILDKKIDDNKRPN